ncbi:peroxiredoxin [Novosphingobium sp.]|uniref:peroxiredoxin n=1 Tax=Novosphingobium sp. TaxID=1874826 RepID=UPI0035B2A446
MNKLLLSVTTVIAAFALPASAPAELPRGAKAPLFSTEGALAGKPFAFQLRQALRKGPVVLYFYPKSFTQGCTLEANAFAEAMGDFTAAGATVIGLSADTIETQQKFSTEHCRDKFPVGVATPAIIKAYDVAAVGSDGKPNGLTNRTSYVISSDGRIRLVYSNRDYRDHVRLTLETVRSIQNHSKHKH